MIKIVLLVIFFNSLVFGANQCIKCHAGIEDIRDRNSSMMKAILDVAQEAGHKGNDCIVCHGGNPKTKSKKYAHRGTIKYFKTHKGPKEYYPSPASSRVNENTCGICHPSQVGAQMNSLMRTQQGEIQDAMWSFGAKEGYEHTAGNYKTKNPDDKSKRVGTDTYRKYMQKLVTMEPQVFVQETDKLRDAPTSKELQKDPSLGVYAYLAQKELHNHIGSKDLGCAACHIPYSKTGDILTHQIQSSRKVKVKINELEYSGIPVQTCSTCHNHGKSIGVSYQGLIESEQKSEAETKHYLHLKEDIHYQLGMLCQDCHTSNDLHGDGFLAGTNLGAVEIECQDCHGTTSLYPWELPIGYSDEFETQEKVGEARGVSQTLSKYLLQGYVPDKEDGYILSVRGNPLPKAVKRGNKIIMHLANGKDIELKPLKLLKEENALSKKALVAMDEIQAHTSKMECYSCHAVWAPQTYGSDLKIDYSKKHKKVTQKSAYTRWEDPALAQNGEGRISPVIPAHQASVTVIGRDKKALLEEHIFKIPNVEGAGDEGQNATTMSPIQPHTITKEARSCESCHTSSKALGLGTSATNLKHNYSQFVDENGTQLMTVGHHFKLSSPLSSIQRDKLDRRGVCISCHIDIPEGNLAVSAMTHVAEMADLNIDNKEHQSILNKVLNIGAWFQVLGLIFILLVLVYIVYTVFIKKKSINPRNRGWK